MARTTRTRSKATGQRATLSRGRMLVGGQTWELNVYKPRVSGQRSDLKLKHLECPLDEADRLLAEQGLRVSWTTLNDGSANYYVGDVYNLATR